MFSYLLFGTRQNTHFVKNYIIFFYKDETSNPARERESEREFFTQITNMGEASKTAEAWRGRRIGRSETRENGEGEGREERRGREWRRERRGEERQGREGSGGGGLALWAAVLRPITGMGYRYSHHHSLSNAAKIDYNICFGVIISNKIRQPFRSPGNANLKQATGGYESQGYSIRIKYTVLRKPASGLSHWKHYIYKMGSKSTIEG